MTDPLREEEMRRHELIDRDNALQMMESAGWDDLEEMVEDRLTLLRDRLEACLDREEYLSVCGEIRGLRSALEMPRTAVAIGDDIIKERDSE